VSEVFPSIPPSIILDDLRTTNSVEMTIDNIVEGRLTVTAVSFCQLLSHISVLQPPIIRSRGEKTSPLKHRTLCFSFYVSFFHCEISELRQPIAVKLWHMIGSFFNFIIWVPKFCGPFPQKLGQKPAKLGSNSDNFRVRFRISQNGWRYPKSVN